jgi:glycosyltransferase involved in cell wall biosynthesis
VISLVVTARNEPPELLRRTIDELRATTPGGDREIVVVDDASEQGVSGLAHDVLVVRNDDPVGVSRARRQGAELTSGDVVVWLDAHMTFASDWLDQMLIHVESGSLLCSAFWNYDRTKRHCYGTDFTWCGERDHNRQRTPGFGLRHRTRFPGASVADVPMAIGACYMMLRSRYDALGGCSPLLRGWGMFERDISARAWLAGLGVKCVTAAAVGHFWRPRFPYPVQFDQLEFNQLVFLRTVFADSTVQRLEPFFEPIPERVRAWLEEAPVPEWRSVVQHARRVDDRAFFEQFLPELVPVL